MRGRSKFVCVALATTLAAGCAGEFDTSRKTADRGTLGREMYTLVCDRVGAQALREDVTGASFHAVCHASAAGEFAGEVDASRLPPLDPGARDVDGNPVSLEQQEKNRRHRIARIEALARRRDDLIAAFDDAMTGEVVGTKDLGNPDEIASCGPSPGDVSEAEIQVALGDMLGRLTDLYNDDTLPNLTRSLARVMDAVADSPDTQQALTRFDARRGYRPKDVAMGVARPALSYPRLVDLANALLRLVSADVDPTGALADPGEPKKKPAERTAADRTPGKGHAALVQLMAVLREELRTAKREPRLGPLTVAPDPRDPGIVVLSRPRGNLELARSVLLGQDEAFSIGEPRWVVARDARGFAKVALRGGEVPPPFVDRTGAGGSPDGLADVDELGLFVTAGAPAPSPFADFRGDPSGASRDADGRALDGSDPVFDYIDVSSTYLASLASDLVPLLEPDPERQHETLMDFLAGFVVAAGARERDASSARDYDGDVRVSYRAYREDASPLLDLVWGIGQVLADETTEDTLALLQKLAADEPGVLARLVGMGLDIKAIADRHPEAKIPAASTLWDEMLDVVVQIAQRPNLVEDVIRAFGDDTTPDLARSAVAYMKYRDHVTYDRNDLNGLPFDVTTGKVEALRTPVDRHAPDSGWNRSAFQRFLAALHDIKGMSVCNKEGAVAHIKWKGVSIDYPSLAAKAACVVLGASAPKDPMPACGMIRIANISQDLVDAVLGTIHLDIRDECMKKLVDSPLTGIVGGADAFLEDVSGIDGFTTKPTVPAISRLAYFDLPYPGHAGDTNNDKTSRFLRDLFDPVPTLVCPPLPFIDTDGTKLNLRQCASIRNTLRDRDEDALFPLESYGFLEASKPLARAFQKNDANLLFVDLFDVLHLHWGSPAETKTECDPSLPRSDPRWCSQDGASSYETLIAEALAGDLFPALHDSVETLEAMTIQHCDARDAKGACTKSSPRDGVKVLAEAVEAMVDPKKNVGLRRRNGDGGVVRNDGTKNPQVTPIYLLIDALKGVDARFAEQASAFPGDDRLPRWRRARSQLTDRLFAVEGKGASSSLRNAAVAKVLPALVATIREQRTAHCPDPSAGCDWGRKELPNELRDVVTGPTFAGAMDVLDAIVSDEAARTELERFLTFLLQSGQSGARSAMLTALVDLLQVFEDDDDMTALLRAVADAAAPEVLDDDGRVASRGLVLSAVEVLSRVLGEVHDEDENRLCSREIDPNRALAVVLRRLVTPPEDGRPPPIEVLIDVAADVNRKDPEDTSKLAPADYESIAREVSEFCVHPSRGLEQVYSLVKQATKDL